MSAALPRESVEYIELTVTVDGAPRTDGVQVAITTGSDRPDDWHAVTVIAGRTLALIGPGTDHPLTPGHYQVWARVTDTPEVPVLSVGRLTIT